MSHSLATVSSTAVADRVRQSTAPELNQQIDRQTDANILHYANASPEVIDERIAQLDCEWDIDRLLGANAATLALAGLGLVLGATRDRKWLVLPGIILPLVLQQGLRGWSPPLPALRHLGLRTRGEIDRERQALLTSKAGGQETAPPLE